MKELTRKEEQVLLAVHHLQQEACLLAICEQVFAFTGTRYSVGTIYAPLNRLHINGYIEATSNRNAVSKKPVRYYHLTKKGYAALADLRKAYHALWAGFVDPQKENS